MGETFLALLTAHLLADFTLQPDRMVYRKRNLVVLGMHVAIVVILAILATGAWPVYLLLVLATSHLIMDALKTYVLKDSLQAFLFDQTIHILIIGALAIAYPQTVAQGWWVQLKPAWLDAYFVILCLLSGLIASVPVGAVIIRKATIKFADQDFADIKGLQNGGYYIGCLERALVMLLILIGQPTGIGFLITAKSILRFSEVKESKDRKMTEYIIIGTFMSFGWGLFIAVLTQLGINHWLLSPAIIH